MNFLQQFIADLQYPVFITEDANQEIQFANTFALSKTDKKSLTGTSLDELVIRYPRSINEKTYGQFQYDWYEIKERKVKSGTSSYLITELTHRPEIPFGESFEHWKRMVEVMLHRLRSPLTGIIGYLEMMEEANEDQSLEKRFSNINKGFDHIFNIMDELEELYQLDGSFDDQDLVDISLPGIIHQTLDHFSDEDKKRIHISENISGFIVHSNPVPLQALLRQVIQNAVRHSSESISITIDTQDPVTLIVENKADELSPEIAEKAFYPFVTSQADDLGIGLSTTLLHAKRIGATLFFESSEDSVAVRLVFPFQ